MRFFAGLAVAVQGFKPGEIIQEPVIVDNWCGHDLHDYYKTTGLQIVYK